MASLSTYLVPWKEQPLSYQGVAAKNAVWSKAKNEKMRNIFEILGVWVGSRAGKIATGVLLQWWE